MMEESASLSTSELSGSYKVINEIQTSQTNSGDYEYPSYLERTPRSSVKTTTPTQLQANEASQSTDTQPEGPYNAGHESSTGESGVYTQPYELIGEFGGQEAVEPTSDSDSDSSDADTKAGRPYIRQVFRKKTTSKASNTLENSERLVIAGNLVDDSAPLSFKSGVKTQRSTTWAAGDDLSTSLSEQGIYQGLVMTDQEKQRLGILPESIYMTTNLLQNWASEIENMSLHVQTASSPNRRSSAVDTPSNPPPPKPFRKRVTSSLMKSPKFMKKSTPSTDTRSLRSIVPYYRDCILRPPPLPPLSPDATRAEKKAYAVVENLLKSEGAFLSSLKIAVQVYMSPLREIAEGPNPILDFDNVQTLFGPIEDIVRHHELFYSALTSRTLDWTSEQRIGDIFMSSMNTKEVIKHYSAYVNNFTSAMFTLEKVIHKKKSFVKFLRDKYIQSNTSLSLQGLLLKPIQRFPQYILFIQDLLKYTSPIHPDRITLQMALARLECIAEYLNEAKKLREQKSVVQNLNTTISRLPFKLVDSERWLYRQDIVTRLLYLNGQVVTKSHRCLLLFNNMVLCAAGKARKKSPKQELESTTGLRDFKGTADIVYTCKWFSPLDKVHLVEPDLFSDIWDLLVHNDNSEEAAKYFRLKESYKKLEHDFDQMTKIASIVSSLHESYQGLTVQDVGTHIRVLQRKIANVKEQIKALQVGRVDLTLPSRDGSKRIHHTYRFRSEKDKLEWLNALRYAKLKLSSSSWVIAEDVNDEDIFELTHKLPLFVESCPLNLIDNTSSIMCATRVGLNSAWLAGGNDESAIVMIVACVTPSPIILECFSVESNRIIDVLYVPPCVHDSTLTSTMRRASLRDTLQSGSLNFIPSHIATVWLGAQNGKLSMYTAQSVENGAKKCLSSITLSDSITSMQYWCNQVFISTAEGSIVIYKRTKAGWDLTNHKTIAVTEATIRCTCVVGNRLWIGVGKLCFFLNMQTHRMEGHMTLNNKDGVMVTRMTLWGEGVWVSYRGIPAVELFHVITKASLQDINIKNTLHTIIKRRGLESKLPVPHFVHVTCLMASCGFLWIGTSIGAILVYRIPRIKGVPIVSGKPYLSLNSHASAVRVLLYVKTLATYSSTRVSQFLSDEQSRSLSTVTPEEDSIYDMDEEVFGFPSEEAAVENGSGLLSDTSSGKKELESSEESAGAGGDTGTLTATIPLLEESTTSQISQLDKSLTPLLPHPSIILLEESSEVMATNDSATVAADEGSGEQRLQRSRSRDKLEENWQEVVDEMEEKKLVVSKKEQQQQQNEQLLQSQEEGQVQTASVVENGAGGTSSSPSLVKLINPVFVESEDKLLCSVEQHYEFSKQFQDQTNQTENSVVPSLIESSGPANKDEAATTDKNDTLTTGSEIGLLANGEATLDGEIELSASGLYSFPNELDGVAPLSREFEMEASGIYSLPDDANSSTLKVAASLGGTEEGPYDLPVELDAVKDERQDNPNPYESPSTLEIGGPANVSPTMFSRQALSSLSAMIPEWSAESKEGAVFVLTAGRGLVNLRPGITSLRGATANGSKDDNLSEGSCMMAYEIEV